MRLKFEIYINDYINEVLNVLPVSDWLVFIVKVKIASMRFHIQSKALYKRLLPEEKIL